MKHGVYLWIVTCGNIWLPQRETAQEQRIGTVKNNKKGFQITVTFFSFAGCETEIYRLFIIVNNNFQKPREESKGCWTVIKYQFADIVLIDIFLKQEELKVGKRDVRLEKLLRISRTEFISKNKF